jgi:hypothetical protein
MTFFIVGPLGKDRRPEFIESEFVIARWQQAIGVKRRNDGHDERTS